MSIYMPSRASHVPTYDIGKSYSWNYEHAPPIPDTYVMQPADQPWKLCGIDVNSPIAIAAGPLLNGRWVLHYAAIGYDVLTYKTVRTKHWPCYDLPNLCPVQPPLDVESTVEAAPSRGSSWAVSFGMPSSSPDRWRFDVEETRRLLPPKKKLSVSVVGSPEDDWTTEQLADDYALCAWWAMQAGADLIELNLSCPNVSTTCSHLYQEFDSAQLVTQRVRERIGSLPLLVKIGLVQDQKDVERTVQAVLAADGIVMINCIPANVKKDGTLLFDGAKRGIAGELIREATVTQITQFRAAIDKQNADIELIAVGGITTEADVERCLAIGAAGVQVATRAM